ncbi:MAG: hypothetical protein ACI814_001025 [Mariniblastus sp.]|jgi:hypothetical protein
MSQEEPTHPLPIAPEAPSLRSVWLHVHVPKAGGSTLRQLMNRNFGKAGFYNSNSLLETKQYTRDDVSEIIRCHPGVACMSDHKLSLDLPYDHNEARVFAFSYVRDPVERFISRYFFHRHFEEVNCIAQRMSFHEFSHAELVEGHAHPQTNSQIYFLNGGTSFNDMSVIDNALATQRAFLFPIERFDESCICLEQRFPETFPDLSYVRTNVSKRDADIHESEKQFVKQFLLPDYAVLEKSHRFLDQLLSQTFSSDELRESTLADFQDRCSRRFDNFYPPVEPGEPVPPIGSVPVYPKPSQPEPEVPHDPRYPELKIEPKSVQETKPELPPE